MSVLDLNSFLITKQSSSRAAKPGRKHSFCFCRKRQYAVSGTRTGLVLRAFAAAPGLKAQGGREHTKCSLLNANNGIVRVVCRSLYPGHTRYARKVPRVSLTPNRRGTLLARILEKSGPLFRDIRGFARIL